MNQKKIIYFYTSDQPSYDHNHSGLEITSISNNKFAMEAHSDGMIAMWDKLASTLGYIVYVIIDAHNGFGHRQYSPSTAIYVISDIKYLLDYINPEDIIIARGGFKPWFKTLGALKKRRQNWILFYRANTNRHGWPFWDVTLNDLGDNSRNFIHLNQYYFGFSKPVNEDIFYWTQDDIKSMNVCIGASHVHSRKGQYLAVRAASHYYSKYGNKLTGVLPGGFIRCSYNTEILLSRSKNFHDIDVLGHIKREDLRECYCKSSMLIHAGTGGQNDRSVLEAMACGTPVVLSSCSHFSSFVCDFKGPNTITSPNSESISEDIHDMLTDENPWKPQEVVDYYKKHNGMNEVCVPKMVRLFKWLENNEPHRPDMSIPRSIEEWKGI